MIPDALIELRGVTWERDGKRLLSEVDLTICGGERWAILGPNGAGKSSLLRVACGYVWPTAGTVLRGGRELVDLQELRRSIGWVSQDLARQIPSREIVLDTVVSGHFAQTGLKRFGRGAGDGPLRERASQLLAGMQCGSLSGKRFGVLSHGERQQVLIARARMAGPMLVVLDEPCGGMDPGVRERFLSWLEQTVAETVATVFVTHHVEEILPSFERTLVINDGRVLAAGSTDDVLTRETLESLYGVSVTLRRDGRRWWPIWGTNSLT